LNRRLRHIADIATQLFLVWVLLAAGAAFIWPEEFRGSLGAFRYVNVGLGVIIFGMGIILKTSDFKRRAAGPLRSK
jgi:bile acid:Na+ symporter, BASS family